MHTEDFMKIAPKGNQGSPAGMKVPAGYFQDFESSVFAKVELEKTKSVVKSKTSANANQWFAQLAIAASFVIGLFVVATNIGDQPISMDIAKASSENIEYYEIDDFMLAENLTMEDLEDISFVEDYISSEQIMEYILDENYSEFTIIDNL
ncbi:MAG: hypothetical protein ACI9GM_000023 [Salibacteraceae bacterium]|jgi:hypothetical protein